MHPDSEDLHDLGRILQNIVIGVMAIQVDNEVNCGPEHAIQAVKLLMFGKYAYQEPTPETSYRIVKEAIESFK